MRRSLNLVLLLLLVNFVSGFRLELRYISLTENIRSSLIHLHSFQQHGFQHAPIVHRNQFFCLYQKDKSDSKVQFRQASNCCKIIIEAAKLVYANKTKESITSQKLGSLDFWWIANSVLYKAKSAYLLYSTARRCCLLHLVKQKCLLKTFLRTLTLMTQVSLYLITLLELIRNCMIFVYLPRWLKRS